MGHGGATPVGVVVLALLLGCTPKRDDAAATTSPPATTETAPESRSMTPSEEDGQEGSGSTSTSVVQRTRPDGWFDLELNLAVAAVSPGDVVDIEIVCPHRGRQYEASVDVAAGGRRLSSSSFGASEPDRYPTSVEIPYWVEPGDLLLTGTCPAPPGPCRDAEDCEAFRSTPTPSASLAVVARDDRPWDVWRPVELPSAIRLMEADGTASVDADAVDLAPGAPIAARLGDTLAVEMVCAPDADTASARFVVMPVRAVFDIDRTDQEMTLEPDADRPGRFEFDSPLIRSAEEFFGSAPPWLVEIPATSTASNPTGAKVVTTAIEFSDDLFEASADQLAIVAECESPVRPFDLRSLGDEPDDPPIVVELSTRRPS